MSYLIVIDHQPIKPLQRIQVSFVDLLRMGYVIAIKTNFGKMMWNSLLIQHLFIRLDVFIQYIINNDRIHFGARSGGGTAYMSDYRFHRNGDQHIKCSHRRQFGSEFSHLHAQRKKVSRPVPTNVFQQMHPKITRSFISCKW